MGKFHWQQLAHHFRHQEQMGKISFRSPSSAGHVGWNDSDMLEIGNRKLTNDEEKTHMAMWRIVKAPLLIRCDLTSVIGVSLYILMNKQLIMVN